METTYDHKVIDFLRGDRPEEEAIDLPWAHVVCTPEAERLPKASFDCFVQFCKGARYWDGNDTLPVYERADFFRMPGATECRRYMTTVHKCLSGVEAPAIITFDYDMEVAHG